MEDSYILSGERKYVSNVVKEQRIRVERGMVSLSPAGSPGALKERVASLEAANKVLEANVEALKKSLKEAEDKLPAADKKTIDGTADKKSPVGATDKKQTVK